MGSQTIKIRFMEQQVEAKLKQIVARYEEISLRLAEPEALEDYVAYQNLSKLSAELRPIVELYQEHERAVAALSELDEWLKGSDPELKALAQEESLWLKERIADLHHACLRLLLPKDPNDGKPVIVEIRAGAGGLEAALFVGDAQRMYAMFAEQMGWRCEQLQAASSDQGGYRECVLHIKGPEVYRWLKYESGTHRVQRIPATEHQGRIHTSTITVAVLPEADELSEIQIDPTDLKVDTFRSSGAGGQHVNTTDSAVRITHVPTGLVVECQDERSQHKNRAKAMQWLRSRLMQKQTDEQQAKERSLRRSLIGSGDRSERIRTYNVPQSRVTDHRIGFTSHDLQGILSGKLTPLLEALQHQDELARMAGLVNEVA